MPGDVLSTLPYPIALGALALLAWGYARARRKRLRPEREHELKKHQQVIRYVPDPDALPLERALLQWLESGTGPDHAARILTKATGEPQEEAVSAATSRRKRESLLESTLKPSRSLNR
jgi:hypothetical protein